MNISKALAVFGLALIVSGIAYVAAISSVSKVAMEPHCQILGLGCNAKLVLTAYGDSDTYVSLELLGVDADAVEVLIADAYPEDWNERVESELIDAETGLMNEAMVEEYNAINERILSGILELIGDDIPKILVAMELVASTGKSIKGVHALPFGFPIAQILCWIGVALLAASAWLAFRNDSRQST